jgi:hypothetical protein
MKPPLYFGALFGPPYQPEGASQCAAVFISIPFPSHAVARLLVDLFKADGKRLAFSSEIDLTTSLLIVTNGFSMSASAI